VQGGEHGAPAPLRRGAAQIRANPRVYIKRRAGRKTARAMKVNFLSALLMAYDNGEVMTPDEMGILKLALPVTDPINWEMVTWP